MREFLPVVLAASEKHWEYLALNFSTPNDAESKNAHGQRLAAALSEFGKGLLTPRERELVEFTLKGHSAAAVGHIMGISPGTVRIHRMKYLFQAENSLSRRTIFRVHRSDVEAARLS